MTVTLYAGVGLSAPDQHKEVFDIRQHESVVQRDRHPWLGRSYRPYHRQCLPYAILCFDQSQVFVASIAGTTESPQWAEGAILWKFDVSRASELSVRLYLKKPNTPRGGQDISLGVARIKPPFKEKQPFGVKWLDVQEGTGRIRIGVEYVENKPSEMGDMEHTYFREYGRFGSVGAWRKKDTQQLYALKTIQTANIGPPSAIPHDFRFRIKINNPFIVPLTFASQSPESFYLLSPFVTGGRLFYYLQKDQCFDTDRSRFYAAEILCAFSDLHDLDIVCHGLGPRNILLNSLGHIAIVCLDLFFPETKDEVRTANGSSRYPAPEALLGHGHYKAADWWTFGAFLHEMLTGLPPFYHEDAGEVRRKILSETLWLPDSLPPSAQDILFKLLERKPEQRLGAKGAFEIKSHPFFDGIDWDMLVRQEYEPTLKPRLIASPFREQAAPKFPNWMDQFSGFTYKRPISNTGEKIETVTSKQKSTLAKDSNESSTTPGKGSIAKASSSTDVAASPQPSSPSQAVVDEGLGWELVWEEATQVFLFHNRSTNAKQSINARDAYPELSREIREPPATHTTLEEDGPAVRHGLDRTSHNLPTQTQKEDVLEAALKARYLQVVPQLLEKYGMNLNIQVLRPWQTPLEWATEEEKLDLVTLFLDNGADPSFPFATGRSTALLRALKKRNRELVGILVQKSDRMVCTIALGLAVDQQDTEMVTTLLANGAKCDFEESDRPRPAGPDEGCFFEDISRPAEFIPPLVRAVNLGDMELVRLLLAHGANANVGYHDLRAELPGLHYESTPPSMACGRVIQLAMDLGHQDMVRLLLNSGADIGLAQPVWRYHECEMVPRDIYFKITAGLRAAAEAMK